MRQLRAPCLMFRVAGLPRHGGSVQAAMASPPINLTQSKMFLQNGETSLPLVRNIQFEFQRFNKFNTCSN